MTHSEKQLQYKAGKKTRHTDKKPLGHEAEISALLQACPESMCLMDADGIVHAINETAARRIGKGMDEIIGWNIFDFLPEAVAVERRKIVEKVIASRSPVIFEDRRDRFHFAANLHPVLDAQGNVKMIAVHARDQTEAIRREENLRQARDYLENLLNRANAPIVVWDQDCLITRFNHAFERLTQRRSSDVIGRRIDILFPEDKKESAMSCIARTLSGEQWDFEEIPIARADGEERTVLWNSATLLGDDGATVIATIAQGQDVTEWKRDQEALRKSHDMLLEETRERKRLSSRIIDLLEQDRKNIAMDLHDNIGQILTMFKMDLERRILGLPPDAQPLRESMQRMSNQCASVLKEIRHTARNLGPFALGGAGLESALHELLDGFRLYTNVKIYFFTKNIPRAIEYNIKLTIFRIVQEALTNVAKHARASEAHINLIRKNNTLRLSIEDNGCGFEIRDASSGLMQEEGIGLPIMKERVLQLGGTLAIDSRKNKGTLLLAEIPLRVTGHGTNGQTVTRRPAP